MEKLLSILPLKPTPPAIRYGVTSLLVGLSYLIVIGIQDETGLIAFYLFFPAVMGSAMVFDRGSGFLALGETAALLYWRVKLPASYALPPRYILPLVLYIAVALVLSLLSEGLRVAWSRAAAAERTKDVLLQELGHRTKNNLAMVVSLLSLQASTKTNPETRQALEKTVARVRAIAGAHDHFQPFDHDRKIEMRGYLETLCVHLGDSLRDVRPIAVLVDVDDVHLSPEQAIPVGLIVNELVTNSLKHAFPDNRPGTIRVSLKGTSPLSLVVEDNGIGCPEIKPARLGSRLMLLLAQQLGAAITWENTMSGCRAQLVFVPSD